LSNQSDREPHAEIICIGDELTSGQRLDTNSQWLSQQLNDIGLRTLFHTTVADDVPGMTATLKLACGRSDVVLMTGGLGPTADDLTRQVIADVAKVPLHPDKATEDHIRQLFRNRGREMPDVNLAQTMFPEGARIIPNATGTAPGIDFLFDGGNERCRLFAFPGVPSELKPMWHDTVRPAILQYLPQLGTIVHHAIHCFGLAESDVEHRLPEIIKRGRVPEVGITATKATITLRIAATGKTIDDCQSLISPTAELIRQELAEYIFGENEITLPEVIVQQLRQVGRSFAVVDAGSCGLVAELLQDADPQGDVYRGCLSMAGQAEGVAAENSIDNARRIFSCDLILWIGPRFQRDETLKRDVILATEATQIQHCFAAASNPAIVAQRSVKQALNFLRQSIRDRKI